MSKRDDIQVNVKPNTYNSFVSPGTKFEFEIDLMDIDTKGATSNTRYGLVAIDICTTIADVVPINNKTPGEMIIDYWFKQYIYLNGKTKAVIYR